MSEVLSEDANKKLSKIAERVQTAKASIDRIQEQKKPSNSALGIFIALLMLPIILLSFMVVLVFAVWLYQNPLEPTAMYGITLIIILGITVLGRGK